LLSAGIAVVFAIVLGVLIDHLLRWWHKRLGRNDRKSTASDTGEAAHAVTPGLDAVLAGPAADTEPGRK
jgi:hypothetical protein